MKLTAKGEATDLDKAAKATRRRRELARTALEHTLPWRVNVQFLGQDGEVVCEWDTNLLLDDWSASVSMKFCPRTDIEVLDE